MFEYVPKVLFANVPAVSQSSIGMACAVKTQTSLELDSTETQIDFEGVVCERLKRCVREAIVVCGKRKCQFQNLRDEFRTVQLNQNDATQNLVGHT